MGCRQPGKSTKTYARWRATYGGMEVSEARRRRQLEEENRIMKQLGANEVFDIRKRQTIMP